MLVYRTWVLLNSIVTLVYFSVRFIWHIYLINFVEYIRVRSLINNLISMLFTPCRRQIVSSNQNYLKTSLFYNDKNWDCWRWCMKVDEANSSLGRLICLGWVSGPLELLGLPGTGVLNYLLASALKLFYFLIVVYHPKVL